MKRRALSLAAALVTAGAAVAVVGSAPDAGAAPSPTPLTPQLITQLSAGAQQPFIVLLRNQHNDVPPTAANTQRRSAQTQADQAPLVQQARETGATRVTQFSVINGFAATMTDAERDHLAGNSQVAAVVPDLPIQLADLPQNPATPAAPAPTPTAPPSPTTPGQPTQPTPTPSKPTPTTEKPTTGKPTLTGNPTTSKPTPSGKPGTTRPATQDGTPTLAPNTCPANPGQPLLEPEALQATNAAFADPSTPQAQSLATGVGVKVGYLADGIDINNPDFVRPNGTKVFTDYKDFTGEGTAVPGDDREAFGDASSIAAQGRQTYDLSQFVNPANPLPANCDIQLRGMAPGASLVGLKVIASNGFGSTSAVVQAIDYAVNVDHVNVLNESLGSNPYPDTNADPFSLANDAAVAAGVTVVTSAGDAGYGNTVDSPASDPNVISAGASTTYQLMAQTRDALPDFSGGWLNDNVSAISSSGTTENGRVDDLVAPGDLNWALCTADTKTYTGCVNYQGKPSNIQAFGGTSEAAPLIAGAAALVIQAYSATHHGVLPTPALVKQLLTSTATDENDPADRQGDGLLNALAAVRAAQSISDSNGQPTPTGNGLLFGANQYSVTGAPGSAQTVNVPVTNVGATPQTVTAHGRALSTVLADQRGSAVLDTMAVGPSFTGPGGTQDNYTTTTFTVPAGADHLDASIAWGAPGDNAVTMALLDPQGRFAGYTMPQSETGPDFGHVDVHAPAAGRWTALIYSPRVLTGFYGPVSYEFVSSAYAPFGTVTGGPLTLAPGQSGTLHVSATTPADAGDQAAAIEVDSTVGSGANAAKQRFAVPLVLRSLVGPDGRFGGVLTGGNGRSGAAAQQNTYRFDVPAGKHDLDVSVTLGGDVNQDVVGYLVSPDGQVLSQASNVRGVDSLGNPTGYSQSVQSYAANPAAGQWSYVVTVANPVSGSATQEPFTGQVGYDSVDVTAANLPASADTVLPAGKPDTVTIHVHNTAPAPESFFVDARSAELSDLQLTPSSAAVNVPLATSAATGYVVPPGTTSLIGVTSGSVPVSADMYANTGEPEALGPPGPGDIAVAFLSSPAVSTGKWGLEADPIGPVTTPVSGTANLTLVARTQNFDGSVTSSTGDQWLGSVLAQAPIVTPLSVDQGGTGTITVTITPKGTKGTKITGTLYVDDTTVSNNAGDQLIALPYSYTIG